MIMHSGSLFTNPYTTEVLRTKKDFVQGINHPDQLLHWLIVKNGIFTPGKKLVLSFYSKELSGFRHTHFSR